MTQTTVNKIAANLKVRVERSGSKVVRSRNGFVKVPTLYREANPFMLYVNRPTKARRTVVLRYSLNGYSNDAR